MQILFFCLFNHTSYLFWWFYRKKWRTHIIHEVPKLFEHGKVLDGLYNCLSKGLRSGSCFCHETHWWNDVSKSGRLYLWLECSSSSGAQIDLAPYSSLSCMKSSTGQIIYLYFICTYNYGNPKPWWKKKFKKKRKYDEIWWTLYTYTNTQRCTWQPHDKLSELCYLEKKL